DDNKINRTILCKMLENDYNIIQAENGKDVISILEEKGRNISVILLDIIMPQMDGYEVMEEVKKNPRFTNIPIIVTTQKEGIEDEIKCLSKGAVDFLTKPYNPLIIKHRIKNTIEMIETAAFANVVQYDILTGLYNKESFYEKAHTMIKANEQPYNIICLDIENFKLVNDMYGEKQGDDLLCFIADLIKDVMVKTSGIAARITGDIFVCIIPKGYVNKDKTLKECFTALKEYPLNFNISPRIGVYEVEDVEIPVRLMCDRARLAAQSIKGKYGTLVAFYDKNIRNKMLLEQEITNEMKDGIIEEQFQVYFQSKCCLKNKQLVGAEALVRWIHPTKGFMSPADFIPLFEKNGFITELDMYVWEKTCMAIRRWIDLGYEIVPISVNVSRVDIYNPKLPQILCDLIKKYSLKTEMLHLEITETAYTENPSQLIAVISLLREKGFYIEMDDFGSGYSSLNMLNEVAVDTIKLDMRFLQSNNKQNHSEDIIDFIIKLAKRLNLSVIAEGIETEIDLKFLEYMGCQYGQGYLFSKPITQDLFEKTMLNKSSKKFGSNTSEQKRNCILSNTNLHYHELISLLDHMPGGVIKYRADEGGHFFFATDSLYHMTGYTREEFKEKFNDQFENFVYKDDRERVLREIDEQTKYGDIDSCEYRVETKNGKLRWFYDIGHLVIDEDGKKWFYVIVVDNTELKYAREKARIEHESYESILPYTKDVIFEWNIMIDEMVCTEMFFQKFGYTSPKKDYIHQMQASGYVHKDDIAKFDRTFCELKKGKKFSTCDVRIQRIDDEYLWCKLCATSILDENNNVTRIIGVLTDINESKLLIQDMKKRADLDPLTNLLNRTTFEKLVSVHIEETKSLSAFIMIDLDRFKQINDKFGHAGGDKVLTVLSKRFMQSFQNEDYIARMGGDEFAVYMRDLDSREYLIERLDYVMKNINKEIDIDGIKHIPECSMGVYVIEKGKKETFNNCYKRADIELYKAKDNGRNCLSFTE
ncbi:MAG: EAL domain-containing protein, partial [Oscillospiraceae bacterium]